MKTTETQTFPGFRPPEANFTATPNEFFDKVLRYQPLCVVMVVGLLIRATNGWRDSVTGDKRVEADMSYADFVRLGMSRGSAQNGVKAALEAGFIVITGEHSNRDKTRYAIRWADDVALKTAVMRQRRANNDQRPLSKQLETGVPNSGMPNSGTPKTGIPNSGTHIKESVEGKESVVYNVSKKPLNVTPDEIARLFGQTFNAEERDLYTQLVLVPVRELTSLTNDFKSRMRFIQLREICLKNDATGAWSAAFISLEKRLQLKANPLGKPGAYFNTVCMKQLENRGIVVPRKSEEPDRAEVRSLIAASLSEESRDGEDTDSRGKATEITDSGDTDDTITPPTPRPKDGETGNAAVHLPTVWNEVLKLVQATMRTATFETHFKTLRLVSLSESDGIATVAAPSDFTKTWIESRHKTVLRSAFSEVVGCPITVAITLPKS